VGGKSLVSKFEFDLESCPWDLVSLFEDVDD